MAAFRELTDAVAADLWRVAYKMYVADHRGRVRAAREPAVPSATAKAADDLIELYLAGNRMTVADLRRAFLQWQKEMLDNDDDPTDVDSKNEATLDHFARLMVRSSIGWMRQALFEGVFRRIPSFTITFNGDELVWEGGDVRNPAAPVDPHRHLFTTTAADTRRLLAPLERRNPPRELHEVPHVKTVAEVRRLLADVKACARGCPGWAVFNEAEGTPEIQTCDECMTSLPKALRLSDDDVAMLPEARQALAEVEERGGPVENPRRRHRANPAGIFTDKGEKLYQQIKAEYAHEGEQIASELAERGVFRKAKTTPGLLKVGVGRPPGVPNPNR